MAVCPHLECQPLQHPSHRRPWWTTTIKCCFNSHTAPGPVGNVNTCQKMIRKWAVHYVSSIRLIYSTSVIAQGERKLSKSVFLAFVFPLDVLHAGRANEQCLWWLHPASHVLSQKLQTFTWAASYHTSNLPRSKEYHAARLEMILTDAFTLSKPAALFALFLQED